MHSGLNKTTSWGYLLHNKLYYAIHCNEGVFLEWDFLWKSPHQKGFAPRLDLTGYLRKLCHRFQYARSIHNSYFFCSIPYHTWAKWSWGERSWRGTWGAVEELVLMSRLYRTFLGIVLTVGATSGAIMWHYLIWSSCVYLDIPYVSKCKVYMKYRIQNTANLT